MVFSTIKFVPLLLMLSPACSAIEFRYGMHFPNGASAVDYIYSQNGTWKSFNPLNYEWNYYEQYATEEHPFDKGALINAANGSKFYTARDANGYLLCDPDHDFEINPSFCPDGSSAAFHEHNGIKAGGVRGGNPFTQFWFDDNYLATFMSKAYLRAEPVGLVDQEEGSFVRWSILSGNISNYWPYNSTHFDTLALDGLFYLGTENVDAALQVWNASVELSEALWNSTDGTWNYPGIHENYHMGLWTILTNFLLNLSEEDGGAIITPEMRELLFQHSVSLRRDIIKNQEVEEGTRQLLGWISNIGSDSALINTESVSCNVLALGAGAKYVFEFDDNSSEGRKFALFYNDENGSKKTKKTGGPSFPLSPGAYTVELVFRAENFTKIHENIQKDDDPIIGWFQVIIASTTNKNIIKDQRALMGSDFKPNYLWSKIALQVDIVDENMVYDFVLEWNPEMFGHIEISSVVVK